MSRWGSLPTRGQLIFVTFQIPRLQTCWDFWQILSSKCQSNHDPNNSLQVENSFGDDAEKIDGSSDTLSVGGKSQALPNNILTFNIIFMFSCLKNLCSWRRLCIINKDSMKPQHWNAAAKKTSSELAAFLFVFVLSDYSVTSTKCTLASLGC